MYYKVKHKETGLYYQPTTSSGSNLGKNGKIYATTSSCLSGNEDYIGITIKKESVLYKKYIILMVLFLMHLIQELFHFHWSVLY